MLFQTFEKTLELCRKFVFSWIFEERSLCARLRPFRRRIENKMLSYRRETALQGAL